MVQCPYIILLQDLGYSDGNCLKKQHISVHGKSSFIIINLQKKGINEFTTLLSQESKADIMQVFEGRLINHPTLLHATKKVCFISLSHNPNVFFCIHSKPT